MTDKEPIQLFIITGFLGSGKTTLMNNLLDCLAEKNEKVGVIINEWGKVSVDTPLIHNQGIQIRELNNGQIFCSCLSGKFVDALVHLSQYPLKYLLVETSGMANPSPINSLLQEMNTLTGQRYNYRGMIGLVDPENFLDLVGVVNAVEEQVINSEYVIINKVDLADQERIHQVREKIKELNPAVPIIETSFTKVEGILDRDLTAREGRQDVERNVKVPYKRPVHYVVTTKENLDPEQAVEFARSLLKDSFRIKGFIFSEKGWFYLDGVNDKVEIKPVNAVGKETKIVIISRVWEDILPRIKSAWEESCSGVSYEIQ
ncbi:MAG: putative GTP-binding protein YjiA [Candidatus Dichloromethanomonas elyunquensis]|nr:MAG: putative GTP-binding protein YjiA [Candidatus Dichloromethanomonas elyunquensis]